ncbi:MAG: DNA mismatch repair endonuclease MutL [Caldilineaceae bacterium SB0662_bin_9]|uniref:DNA mismatch repair protein MutL n=1 Tax=Caldilineaceae bacterium SB0662_bin_9 TaxID=2605258 RepID=A0A6B1DXL8_9CHLR|nr:DNA mismatch repair endonuclease MutL [Caldilineaceae bacterium SB0662_bin_9]
MAIQPLSAATVARIAAGEVIERPVDAVRELVENSLDAHARHVDVALKGGGLELIRVADDGDGIPADELQLAFQRHATSKLADSGGLDRIQTLGFRGEALFSIGAVSHVTVESRHRQDVTGSRLRFACGQVEDQAPAGAVQGTTLQVEQLFVNAPVRQRFLKSATAEAGRVSRMMQRYALAWPGVAFAYSHNDRVLMRTHGRGDVREVLLEVHGRELARQALSLEGMRHDIKVAGFVSPPTLHYPNRGHIDVFVNGRWIQDRSVTQAVVQGCHGRLPGGRFPFGLIFIEMDPVLLDVNVHPRKAEVRCLRDRALFAAVLHAVEDSLAAYQQVPEAAPLAVTPVHEDAEGQWRGATSDGEGLALDLPRVDLDLRPHGRLPVIGKDDAPPDRMEPVVGDLPPLHVIGQVGQMYIVAETSAGMVLVDQHAAHERVLYEAWLDRERVDEHLRSRQALLVPETLEIGTEIAGLIDTHLGLLSALGFDIAAFGGSTYVVRAMPALLADRAPRTVLREVLDCLADNRDLVHEELERRLVRVICKRSAIKAGQPLGFDEMESLLTQLGNCENPLTCPHGRPTIVQFSSKALAKAFGRS